METSRCAPSKQEVLPSMIRGKQAIQYDPGSDTPALCLSSLPPPLSSESIATPGVYRPDRSKEAADRERHLGKRRRKRFSPPDPGPEVRVLDPRKCPRAPTTR